MTTRLPASATQQPPIYLAHVTHDAIMSQNHIAEVHCCDAVLLCCYADLMLPWLLMMCAVLVAGVR